MQVDWQSAVVQHDYEDMVAVLIKNLYSNAQHIDGAGGDEGRDIIVETPQGLIIYECKRFARRVEEPQRNQIRRSLARAAQHNPMEWHLVVPVNPTPAEERFFERLQRNYDFPLVWRGRAWLNQQMANFPAVRRYFLEDGRDEALRLLKEFRLDVEDLEDVSAAVTRIEEIHRRLNDLDAYYSYEIATGTLANRGAPPGAVLSVERESLRIDVIPRFRSAVIDRPITGRLVVKFASDDSELRERFDRAIGFGESVELPSSAVETFEIDAPGGLVGNLSDGTVKMSGVVRSRQPPLTVYLTVLDANNAQLGQLTINMDRQRSGSRGGTLWGSDSTNQVQLELRYDSGEATSNLTYRPRPLPPGATRPIVEFLTHLKKSHRLQLAVGSQSGPRMSCVLADDYTKIPAWFVDIVDAFERIQQRVKATFDLPSDLTSDEIREILELGEELGPDGRRYRWLERSLGLVHVPDSAGLDILLGSMEGALLLTQNIKWEFRGEVYDLGWLRTTYMHAVVDGEAAHIRSQLVQQGRYELRIIPGADDSAHAIFIDEDDPLVRGEPRDDNLP